MKKLILVLIGLILLAGLPIIIYVANQRQEIRNKAAPATTLLFLPSTVTKKVGEIFSLEAQINTGENQVVAAEIHVLYDPTKLEAQSITNGPLFPSVLTSGVVENGTASITVGAASAAQPVKGTGTIATIRFKALAKTDTPLSIKFATNTFVGGLGEGANNVLINSAPASVTITQDGTTAPNSTPTRSSSISATPTRSSSVSPTTTRSASPTPSRVLTPTSGPSSTPGPTITLTISSPTQDEEVVSAKPVIKGRATAGSTITVTIYSDPQTCLTTATSTGDWSCTPTTDLTAGPHSIVVTATSANGTTQTASAAFVVATAAQSAGEQSTIPVSGSTETTIVLIIIGSLLLLSGATLPLIIP